MQRDMYSAFLLGHLYDDLATIDNASCSNDFDAFVTSCNTVVGSIKDSGSKYLQWYVH